MAQTEKLIELVKNYPLLFDMSHEDYKCVAKKDRIWNAIGQETKLSGEEAKKRWKNLKDTYAKYLKGTKRSRKWLWTDHMEDFEPFIGKDKVTSTSNTNEIESFKMEHCEDFEYLDVDAEYLEQNLPAHTQILHSPSELSTSKCEKKPRFREPASFHPVNDTTKCLTKEEEMAFDATDSLFLALAKTVKTFSGRRQALAKMKIAQLVMEQELLNHEEIEAQQNLNT